MILFINFNSINIMKDKKILSLNRLSIYFRNGGDILALMDGVNFYKNNGYEEIARYGNDAYVLRGINDKNQIRILSTPSQWKELMTIEWTRPWVERNPLNGGTGFVKGQDRKWYDYVHRFIPRVIKPDGFMKVTWAALHVEISKTWAEGWLCSRQTSLNRFDLTRNIWTYNWWEDRAWVSGRNTGLRFVCTDFVQKIYNGQSNLWLQLDDFPQDLRVGNIANDGYAHGWIKPFDGTGYWNSSMADRGPHFEIAIECKYNDPPVANFDMQGQAFAGNNVHITSRNWDPNGDPMNISWSISPMTYGANLGPGGGDITFTQPGTYNVTMNVNDNKGGSDSITKSIDVIAKGNPKLSVSLTPNITSMHLGTYYDVWFNFKASVSGYQNSGKVMDWAKIDILKAAPGFSGSTITSPTGSWSHTCSGEHTWIDAWGNIPTTVDDSLYNQYYEVVFTVHYSDTNTTSSVRQLIHIDTHNNKPNDPTINYPLANTTFHGRRPVFLVTTGADIDGDPTFQRADFYRYDGSYNLVSRMDGITTHANYMSPTGYYAGGSSKKIKMAPYVDLNGDYVKFYTLTEDKYGASSDIPNRTIYMPSKSYVQGKLLQQDISISLINTLIKKINDNCWAYGLPMMEGVSAGDEINVSLIISMIDHINSYVSKVNNWSAGTTETNMNAAVITYDRLNESMLDILNKIVDQLFE